MSSNSDHRKSSYPVYRQGRGGLHMNSLPERNKNKYDSKKKMKYAPKQTNKVNKWSYSNHYSYYSFFCNTIRGHIRNYYHYSTIKSSLSVSLSVSEISMNNCLYFNFAKLIRKSSLDGIEAIYDLNLKLLWLIYLSCFLIELQDCIRLIERADFGLS